MSKSDRASPGGSTALRTCDARRSVLVKVPSFSPQMAAGSTTSARAVVGVSNRPGPPAGRGGPRRPRAAPGWGTTSPDWCRKEPGSVGAGHGGECADRGLPRGLPPVTAPGPSPPCRRRPAVRRRTALSGSREPAPRRRGPDAEDPGRQAGRSRPAARGHRRSRSTKRSSGGGNLVSDHPHRPSEHAPAGDARCSASAPGCSGLTPASGWGSPGPWRATSLLGPEAFQLGGRQISSSRLGRTVRSRVVLLRPKPQVTPRCRTTVPLR
jgi:hypothetical protein